MDYCSSCRRHLNGALVCPGCGAYAPDIAPVTLRPAQTTTYATVDNTVDAVAHAESRERPARPVRPVLPVLPEPEVPPVASAPPGRAARRRQLARWKKNQRRAVVATAVALVGGGLTVSALDRQGGDRAQAATAPENPTTYGGEVPTSEHTRPTVDRSDAHRPSTAPTAPTRPPSTATELGGERYTPSNAGPDGAAAPAAPRTAASPSAAQQGTGASSYGGAVTTPTGTSGTSSGQQAATPAAGDSAADSSGSTSTSPSTSAPTSGSSSAPAATSPSDICLLGLICLG
ncbi:SCO2400 family protein [Streptomyces sp. NPDC001858]